MFRRSTDETRIESRSQAQYAYAAEWVGRVGGVQSQSARGVTSREDRGLGVSQCARETTLQRLQTACPMTWDGRRCHRMPPRCCRPGPGVSRLKESARSPSFLVSGREKRLQRREGSRGNEDGDLADAIGCVWANCGGLVQYFCVVSVYTRLPMRLLGG